MTDLEWDYELGLELPSEETKPWQDFHPELIAREETVDKFVLPEDVRAKFSAGEELWRKADEARESLETLRLNLSAQQPAKGLKHQDDLRLKSTAGDELRREANEDIEFLENLQLKLSAEEELGRRAAGEIQSLEKSNAQAAAALSSQKKKTYHLQGKLAATASELKASRTANAQLMAIASDRGRQRAERDERETGLLETLTNMAYERLRLDEEITALKANNAELLAKLHGRQEETENSKREVFAAAKELVQLGEQVQSLKVELADREKLTKELNQKLAAKDKQWAELEVAFGVLQTKTDVFLVEHQRMTAQKKFLETFFE